MIFIVIMMIAIVILSIIVLRDLGFIPKKLPNIKSVQIGNINITVKSPPPFNKEEARNLFNKMQEKAIERDFKDTIQDIKNDCKEMKTSCRIDYSTETIRNVVFDKLVQLDYTCEKVDNGPLNFPYGIKISW